MGHRHDGALVLLQVLLEPRHRLRVEVVRRLVQQQQVGGPQQQPAERHAAALAAGQRLHVRVAGREPQRVHRDLERGVEVPGVGGVDPLLEPRELVGGLVGVVGRQLVEAVEQVAQVAHAVLDVAAHVLGRVELRLLLEQADGARRGELRLAAELGVLPGHDAQQGGLARAVGAEHADLGSGQEGQRDVLQHLLVGRVHAGQLVHREDVLARHRAVEDRVRPWDTRFSPARFSSEDQTFKTPRPSPPRRGGPGTTCAPPTTSTRGYSPERGSGLLAPSGSFTLAVWIGAVTSGLEERLRPAAS